MSLICQLTSDHIKHHFIIIISENHQARARAGVVSWREVEVDVLGSPSGLMVRTVSVDVQVKTKTKTVMTRTDRKHVSGVA